MEKAMSETRSKQTKWQGIQIHQKIHGISTKRLHDITFTESISCGLAGWI